MHLFWFALLPVIIGLAGYFIPLYLTKYLALFAQIIQLIMAVYLLYFVRSSGPVAENLGDWPDYVGITLQADSLSAIMIALNCTLFFMCGIFNLKNIYVDRMFLFLFLTLEGLISGIFLSRDLFNIFVLVEISVVIVSILIMFKRDAQSIYDGIIYLLTNTVAMTLFLFGIAFLYKSTGLIDMEGIEKYLRAVSDPRIIILPYGLMITAVSLKAALMPLFSWLPKAHGTPSAPSVVSAVLSGIYIKTGIYLFIRLQNMFSPLIDTHSLFLVLGFLTAVIGFIFVLLQNDIKLILAYSTVSQIGFLMIGINLNNPIAFSGAIYHMISHGIFKTTLFLTAGMIVDEYHTRNIHEIHGLWKRMPVVAFSSALAILGIIGTPFFNGSISKYWISYGTRGTWLEYGLLFLNLGTILAFMKYSLIFLGPTATRHSALNPLRGSVVLFGGILCFLGGIFSLPLSALLFDIDMPLDGPSYVLKSIWFILTMIVAFLLFYFFLRKANWFDQDSKIELSFNQICVAIFTFLVVIMLYSDLIL